MVLLVGMSDSDSNTRIAIEREINMKQSRENLKDDIMYFVGQMLYGIEVQTVPKAFDTDDIFVQIRDVIDDTYDHLTDAELKARSILLCSIPFGAKVLNVSLERPKLVSSIKLQ